LRALIDALTADTRPGDVVSLHGSIPVGLSDDAWIEVCNGATRKGARVLVDTYGNPLLRVLGGTPVFAAKPNEEEISVLTETRNVPFTTAAAAALREMNRLGVILPFVSLGERGIAFLAGEHPRIASCRVRQPTVLVGAGDACVGALAVALARGVVDVEELVAFMVAAGAAHVSDVAPDEFADETRALSAHVQVGPLAR
jgi:fructose-1-phosphate kinase PfkB-like protein